MSNLDSLLEANRAALDDFIAAAEPCRSVWSTPRAPGKWSPSQLAEHVARALEEGGNVVAERPSKLPTLPFFLRPLTRMFFKRILKKGAFPKARTNKAMNPENGPENLAEARNRLRSAMEVFDRECRARAAAGGTFSSGAFGSLTVEEYAKFQELHTRHHTAQMVPAD